MNKSSILKRAGDYITHLERANKTLMADNNRMKSVLVQVYHLSFMISFCFAFLRVEGGVRW